MEQETRRPVYVIGHKNPDTDSVCSALAYAWLKNQQGTGRYEACRAGALNRETEFVLQHLGVEPPPICSDISPQVRDIDIRRQPGIDPELSVRAAWAMMKEAEVDTLCITDGDNRLQGLITVKDIANANMDLLDTNILAAAKTGYRNILSTLEADMLVGHADSLVYGQIRIGTSPEALEGIIRPGDLVLLSNRYEVQLCAIESGAACIIVCCGSSVAGSILSYAREKGCAVMATAYDTYAAARLISTAAPVRHLMQSENIVHFDLNTPLEEVQKVMASLRFRYFPVLDEQGRYCGLISRRNFLNLRRKQVILVDHNERTQAVDGLEQAEILEIIDHHRIGSLETGSPVYFRNVPVGCTATILYGMMEEQKIVPPKQIAGLLLSAILSDTRMFRSPTSTSMDEAAARALAVLAEEDIPTYAGQMFEAGGDLTGRTPEELFRSDFKVFEFGEHRFGVGQSFFMTEKLRSDAEALLRPYLPEAAMKAGIPLVFYMLTNTLEEDTNVICWGEHAEEMLERAFGRAPEDGRLSLPGVVSRKMQMIPPLRLALNS